MLKSILILFGRKIIHVYTAEVGFFILQKRPPIITGIIIISISLVIWFGFGLILAYRVKKNMAKGNLEGKY